MSLNQRAGVLFIAIGLMCVLFPQPFWLRQHLERIKQSLVGTVDQNIKWNLWIWRLIGVGLVCYGFTLVVGWIDAY